MVLRHRIYGSSISTGHTCWRSSFSVFKGVLVFLLSTSLEKEFQSLSVPFLFLSLPEVGSSQSCDLAWDADWYLNTRCVAQRLDQPGSTVLLRHFGE